MNCGQVVGVVVQAVFSQKIPTLEGMQAEKKRKFLQRGQLERGSRRTVRVNGDGNGGDAAAAVLAGWLVRSKSKINCAPLSIVLFQCATNLFCTVGRFAPAEELAGMLEADELEGCQAEGPAGLYPPLHLYSWNDKWFWFAEIFFRFSGRLG